MSFQEAVPAPPGSPLDAVLDGLSAESAVRVAGHVRLNPVVSLGGLELVPDEVTLENNAAAPLAQSPARAQASTSIR